MPDLPPPEPPAGDEPHAGSGRPAYPALTAAAEVLLCSGLPTQLLILQVLALAGWAPSADNLQPLLVLLLADTALLVAIMVALMRAHGERPSTLWLGARPVGREALLGVWLVPPVFLLVVVLLNALRLWAPWLHNVPENPLEGLAATGAGDAALFAGVAIIAGGVREELQRAFLLDRFERHLGGPVVGVIVLSIGFGAGHVAQGRDAMIVTGVIGAFWALVYLWRRSSIAPIVSHSGFNALEVLRVALLGGGSV